MRLMLSLMTALLVMTSVSKSEAANISIFAGASNNFIFPGSLRLGVDAWEFGMLHQTAYGAVKNFSWSSNYYSSFGFALTAQGESSFGFWGAMGFKYGIFWGLNLRGEIFGVHAVNGYGLSAGILGLGFNF